MTGIESALDDAEEELRQEAARWFARLRGPDGPTLQPEFTRWLAADPGHLEAYNRTAELFSIGKGLKAIPFDRPTASLYPAPHRRTGRVLVSSLVTASIAAVAGISVWHGASLTPPSSAPPPAPSGYAALAGQQRSIGLPDGSTISLDRNSRVAVLFSHERREVRLLAGRARFDVAHQGRPFVVIAGTSTITDHGTLFDVGFDSAHAVTVRLLRGSVDVAGPVGGSRSQPAQRWLRPGEQLAYRPATGIGTPEAFRPEDSRWLSGTIDFEQTPIKAILAQANQSSGTAIRLDAPDVADTRVSGSFRVDAPTQLANSLAALFDLSIAHDATGAIVLSKR